MNTNKHNQDKKGGKYVTSFAVMHIEIINFNREGRDSMLHLLELISKQRGKDTS